MDINFIQNICGLKPANFQKVVPTDSNYIFENDPSFQPLNLYDFLNCKTASPIPVGLF